ncbi:20062_t:CDS:2, partial [Racocetra fulgida]
LSNINKYELEEDRISLEKEKDGTKSEVKMLKAGAKSSIIYKAIRSEDGTPTATSKDIFNLSIWINSLEETASITALIMGIEKRAYT